MLPYGNASYTHGTVLEGTSPLSGLSLDDKPQDNITPWRFNGGLRVSDQQERWWGGYSVRAAGEVNRVSPLLDESPFLIAQDLLALGRLHDPPSGRGLRLAARRPVASVSSRRVDNLTDKFYREQFQFAPARGRSFTLSSHREGRTVTARRVATMASAVHYLPILTTALSALFATSLYRRWRARRSPHLWWWAFGITTYGLGTAIESTITLGGNSVLLTKVWYIAGAHPRRLSAGPGLAVPVVATTAREQADRLRA